jgi:hypothetical protein
MNTKMIFVSVLTAIPLFASASAFASTFSIVALPDTQYYHDGKAFVYQDQTTWIKNNASKYDIQLVLGLGDITDNGGGTNCATALPNEASGPMWTNASTAIGTLDSANIPYMLAIGNHDYDCHEDVPIPRSASGFNQYFGPARYMNQSWFANSQHGWYQASSSENFYNTFTINGRSFLVMSLEFYPRDAVLSWANNVVSSFSHSEVIVITHGYLNYDTLGSPGTAPRLAPGMGDSAGSFFPTFAKDGSANNGIDMWKKFVSLHSNIRTVLSGHIRGPGPGNTWAANNGVGHRSDLNSSGQHVNQLLSDYQGEGLKGYFGFGFLRIYTFDDVANTLSVQTYSPAIEMDAAKMTKAVAGTGTTIPAAWKTDAYNNFTMTYDPLISASGSGGTSETGVQVTLPANGATLTSPVTISATANENVSVSQMQVWIDGKKLGSYAGASVNTTATLAAGTHKISVLDLNSSYVNINKNIVTITVK